MADDVNPMPVQEPIPGPMEDPKRLRERILALAAGTDGPVADSKYLAAAVYPQQLAELEETTEYGPLQLAIVRLRPVQYVAAEKCFLFFPKLRYRIRFDAANARRRAEQRSEEKAAMGEYRAELLGLLLHQDRVIAARDLLLPDRRHVEEVPHVVITDNFEWPESVERPDGTTPRPGINERARRSAAT